jgi:phage major head subunit gpT-like protein
LAATRDNAALILTRGLKEVFSTSYDEPTLLYPQLFHVVESDKDYEEFLSFAGFGYFPTEGEMELVQLQEALLGFKTKITPVRFGLGFEVSNELVDDEKYGWIGSLSGELGQALRSTKEKHAFDLLNNGFSASFPLADGKALFATDHPLKRGGTGSNRLATDSDLTYASLQSMVLLLRKTTNDAGIPRPITGTLTLWVPPETEMIAAELLKSVGRPDTANRADNVLTKQRRWDLQVGDYLTDTDAFFVAAEKRLHKLVFIDRMKMRQWVKVDEETYSTKHIVRSRFKVGAADWRGIAGTPGAP